MDATRITDAELEILKILWEQQPLTGNEIINAMPQSNWNSKTIRTLILRCEEKGAIEANRSGKEIQFSVLCTKDEYMRQTGKSLADKLFAGSIGKLLLHFMEECPLDDQEIEELKALIEHAGK